MLTKCALRKAATCRVLEGLALHDVAPMAGRVADAQEDAAGSPGALWRRPPRPRHTSPPGCAGAGAGRAISRARAGSCGPARRRRVYQSQRFSLQVSLIPGRTQSNPGPRPAPGRLPRLYSPGNHSPMGEAKAKVHLLVASLARCAFFHRHPAWAGIALAHAFGETLEGGCDHTLGLKRNGLRLCRLPAGERGALRQRRGKDGPEAVLRAGGGRVGLPGGDAVPDRQALAAGDVFAASAGAAGLRLQRFVPGRCGCSDCPGCRKRSLPFGE